MGMFSNLATSDDMSSDSDVLGGGRTLLESGIYLQTIEYAYGKKAGSGAMGITVALKGADGSIHKETMYASSGDAKGNRNYYMKDGEKYQLPGFAMVNSLCLLTTGKELSDLDTSEKFIKLWNGSSEEPTQVDMIDDLIGKEILTAIYKQTEDKQVKGDDGTYSPDGTTRDVNEIAKFFRASDKLTVSEITNKATAPTFHDAWLDKWKGEVRNTVKGGGKASTPTDTNSDSAPKTLFSQ